MSETPVSTRIETVPMIRGLLGRMLLVGVLPTILVIGGLVWLQARHEFVALEKLSLESLQIRADLLAESVEDVNTSAQRNAMALADAQVSGMINHGQMAVDFSRSILEREADITAAFLAFEPGVHSADQLVAVPSEALTEDGRLAPYWFIDPDRGDTIQLEVAPSLDTGDYYTAPRNRWMLSGQRSLEISEPYLNDGRLQLDMSMPIVEGGKFVGVAGVSRALSDQEMQLREFLEDSGDEAFLLSPRGRFVAASMDEQRLDERDLSGLLKTQLIASTGYGELFGPIVSSHQQEVFLATDPMDGKSYYYAPSRIGTGDWKIVLRRSENSVLDPIVDDIIESIILGVVGVLLVVLLLSLLAVSVSRRLRHAMHRASRIAEGDLRSDVDARGMTASDETGVLLKTMDRMGTRLRGFVGGVIASGEAVERTADSVANSSSDQVQVASALGQSTARIGDAVQQIRATSQDLNETVASVTEAADQTSMLATEGRDELEDMQSAMQRLESATDAISRRLAVINERAAGITGIVSTITSVADQTNLLSVNASIEAEKAGDAGRGFHIVAREIRRLADRSSSATLEIESTVKEVETAIGEGVREMSSFSAEVGRIVSDVTAVTGAMSAIIEQVAVSTGRFHSLQEGVQSQRKGAEAISNAMSDLQEGSERTIQTTETLVGASEDLRHAVEELGSVVSAFNLGPTPDREP